MVGLSVAPRIMPAVEPVTMMEAPSHKCARYSTRPLHQAAIISRQHVQGNTTSAEQIFGAIAENGAAG